MPKFLPSAEMDIELKKEESDKTSQTDKALDGAVKGVTSYTIYEIKNYRTKRENYKSFSGTIDEVVDMLENDNSYHEIIMENDFIKFNIDIEAHQFDIQLFEMYLFSYLVSTFQGNELIDKFSMSLFGESIQVRQERREDVFLPRYNPTVLLLQCAPKTKLVGLCQEVRIDGARHRPRSSWGTK